MTNHPRYAERENFTRVVTWNHPSHVSYPPPSRAAAAGGGYLPMAEKMLGVPEENARAMEEAIREWGEKNVG